MATEFELISEDFDEELRVIRDLVDGTSVRQTRAAPRARVALANSATLLLAATFEEFVRQMAVACARLTVAKAKSVRHLPDRLVDTAWRTTMKRLGEIRLRLNTGEAAINTSLADARREFDTVYAFCTGDLDQEIFGRVVQNENNMRPDEINRIFRRCGLKDIVRQTASDEKILTFFSEDEPDRACQKLRATLNDFFERRNRIAHSLNPQSSSSPGQIGRDVEVFSSVGKALCQALEAETLDGKDARQAQ